MKNRSAAKRNSIKSLYKKIKLLMNIDKIKKLHIDIRLHRNTYYYTGSAYIRFLFTRQALFTNDRGRLCDRVRGEISLLAMKIRFLFHGIMVHISLLACTKILFCTTSTCTNLNEWVQNHHTKQFDTTTTYT